jgi:GTP cyclohydrolase I
LNFPIYEDINIIEKYISTIEQAFSCKVYPTLKIEDEIFVTESSYMNPKFVEDIIRDAVVNLNSQ